MEEEMFFIKHEQTAMGWKQAKNNKINRKVDGWDEEFLKKIKNTRAKLRSDWVYIYNTVVFT